MLIYYLNFIKFFNDIKNTVNHNVSKYLAVKIMIFAKYFVDIKKL